MLTIFANNILPILLLSGAGFVLGRTMKLDSRPLARVIFYILSPLLVFNLISQSQLSLKNIFLMMAFASSVMLTCAALAFLTGKLLRLERSALTVAVLTSLLANNGNFGMPIIGFAFGQEALAYASIYFVTSSLFVYTLGVLLASLGHMNLKAALVNLLKVPAIYAIIIAMIFVRTGWILPDPIQHTVTLAAAAAIPAMLILLGIELQRAEWTGKLRLISVPVIIRLVIGPLVGLGMAALFGFQGNARLAGITEAGMPSAVMNTVLATEYKLDPALVTAVVFIGTILSPLTLTLLLYFLGR